MRDLLGIGRETPRQALNGALMQQPTNDSDRTPTPPAGWYPCEDRLRWWNGTAWTNNWEKRADKSWSKSAEVGMWLAVIIPFIGFLMGLALVAGRDRHAHWVVLTSIAVPLLAALVWLA
jgi:hypothetical protein